MPKLVLIGKQRYWCLNKHYILNAWYLSGFEWGALEGITSILQLCGLTGGFKALVYVLKSMVGRFIGLCCHVSAILSGKHNIFCCVCWNVGSRFEMQLIMLLKHTGLITHRHYIKIQTRHQMPRTTDQLVVVYSCQRGSANIGNDSNKSLFYRNR